MTDFDEEIPQSKRPDCCQMGHDHIWWKNKTFSNREGWFLHGWLYLVLCIWCGKRLVL